MLAHRLIFWQDRTGVYTQCTCGWAFTDPRDVACVRAAMFVHRPAVSPHC